MAIELTHEIGRRITTITEDTRENTLVSTLVHGASNWKCGLLPEDHDHRSGGLE